jgi:hypothetical protein
MHGNNHTTEGLTKYLGTLQFIYDPKESGP